MSSPLQKFPPGLLGMLDLKTLGRAPDEFDARVQPVLETREFYLIESRRIEQTNIVINNPNVNGGITFDVPRGEIWRVHSLSVSGTVNPADAALNGYALFSMNDGVSQVTFDFKPLFVAGSTPAAGSRAAGFVFPEPIYVRSGWGLLVVVEMLAAPAVSFTAAASICYDAIAE